MLVSSTYFPASCSNSSKTIPVASSGKKIRDWLALSRSIRSAVQQQQYRQDPNAGRTEAPLLSDRAERETVFFFLLLLFSSFSSLSLPSIFLIEYHDTPSSSTNPARQNALVVTRDPERALSR